MIDYLHESLIYGVSEDVEENISFEEFMPKERPTVYACDEPKFRFLALMRTDLGIEVFVDVLTAEDDVCLAKAFVSAAFPGCEVVEIRLVYEADL